MTRQKRETRRHRARNGAGRFVIFNTVAREYYTGGFGPVHGSDGSRAAETTPRAQDARHFPFRGHAVDWLARYFPEVTRDVAVIEETDL